MSLERLQVAAQFVRHHHERYDGQGYPDGLEASSIPLGSRIIAVAADYDDLKFGLLLPEAFQDADARKHIRKQSKTMYDPAVVEALINGVSAPKAGASGEPRRLNSESLSPGMVLDQDLMNFDGMLLLRAGSELREATIRKIKRLESELERRYVLQVK